jgi:hypothetical protein
MNRGAEFLKFRFAVGSDQVAKKRALVRPAKKRPAKDQLGKSGEDLVAFRLSSIGLEFNRAGEKTPSIDGYVMVHDATTNLHLAVQVKTGKSFLRKKSARHLHVALDPTDVRDWRETNTPVVVVWVDGQNADSAKWTAYWASATRASASVIKIPCKSTLDAHSRTKIEDVVRAHAGRAPQISSAPLFPAKTSEVKVAAWDFFQKWRREGSLSPLFGKIDLTRRAWRHITRVSRPQREVAHKLSLLPCAKAILESASRSEFRRKIETATELIEYHSVNGVYKAFYRRDAHIEVIVELVRPKISPSKEPQVRFFSVYERNRYV